MATNVLNETEIVLWVTDPKVGKYMKNTADFKMRQGYKNIVINLRNDVLIAL